MKVIGRLMASDSIAASARLMSHPFAGEHRSWAMTFAPMESLVKQINLYVKGKEMFWIDSTLGGESILQIGSATLPTTVG